MSVYIVHYRCDDVARTPGRCRTDHRLQRGDTIYVGSGRAVVRSCILDIAVDQTFSGRNARLLRSLAGSA